MDASQHRREFKFVLPPGVGEVFRDRVSRWMTPDRGADEGYPVLSEYFDTTERTTYWQKQFGALNRRRVRSRVYGRRDGAIPMSAFIEVKHKLDGETVKRRIPAALDELGLLAHGQLPVRETPGTPAEERILAEIADLVKVHGSRPVVQIRYHRYAYDSGPEGTIRITFDQDPRCRFRLIPLTPDDPDFELPLLEPGSWIMEVKTIGPVPYWFRHLLGEFNLMPRGFSKYAAALELYEFKNRTLPAAASSPPHPADRSGSRGKAAPGDGAATSQIPPSSRPRQLGRGRGLLHLLATKLLSGFRTQNAR